MNEGGAAGGGPGEGLQSPAHSSTVLAVRWRQGLLRRRHLELLWGCRGRAEGGLQSLVHSSAVC